MYKRFHSSMWFHVVNKWSSIEPHFGHAKINHFIGMMGVYIMVLETEESITTVFRAPKPSVCKIIPN